MPASPEAVRIDKPSTQLTKKQRKLIRQVFSKADYKLERQIHETEEATMGGKLKGSLSNKRTVVLGRLARVSYKRKEKGSLAWQGSGNSDYETDEILKSRLRISFADEANPATAEAEAAADIVVDLNRKPVDEALRLIGGLSIADGTPVGLDRGVELVCQIVQEATASVT
jgi:hypothetical protein